MAKKKTAEKAEKAEKTVKKDTRKVWTPAMASVDPPKVEEPNALELNRRRFRGEKV